MKELVLKSKRARVSKVRKLIEAAGNQLVAVSFITRGDGTKRKMVFRRRVEKPTYASIPHGHRPYNPKNYDLLTVFDTNVLKYNRQHRLNGRGGWKSIPLDGITRIKTGGMVYRIIS